MRAPMRRPSPKPARSQDGPCAANPLPHSGQRSSGSPVRSYPHSTHRPPRRRRTPRANRTPAHTDQPATTATIIATVVIAMLDPDNSNVAAIPTPMKRDDAWAWRRSRRSRDGACTRTSQGPGPMEGVYADPGREPKRLVYGYSSTAWTIEMTVPYTVASTARDFGSNTSRSASPRKFSDKSVTTSVPHGNSSSHQYPTNVLTASTPSAASRPSDGVGG